MRISFLEEGRWLYEDQNRFYDRTGRGGLCGRAGTDPAAPAGEPLRIVAGGARKARLERQGVVVNGEHYDCFVTDPETDCGPADLVIVSVKYHALPQAIADLKHHVGEHTILLSLMNGVNSRQIIGQTYGIEKCLYGICNLSTVNHGIGVFTVSHMKGGISIGEARNAPPYSERLQAVASLFDEAGIDYQIPQDMVHAQWWKFLLNVGGNCTNTVLRARRATFRCWSRPTARGAW